MGIVSIPENKYIFQYSLLIKINPEIIGEISQARLLNDRYVPRIFPVLESSEKASRKTSILKAIKATITRCNVNAVITTKKLSQTTRDTREIILMKRA